MAITTSAQRILGQMREQGLQTLPDSYWDLLESFREELVQQADAILSCRADAEDVVQETFCEALQHSEKLEEAESLTGWLKAINKANALNRLRGNGRALRASQSKRENGRTRSFTTGGFSFIEARELVEQAIARFPAEKQKVLRLRYWNGLGYQEIADELKMPIGTVSRILFQASQLLHKEFRAHIHMMRGLKQDRVECRDQR